MFVARVAAQLSRAMPRAGLAVALRPPAVSPAASRCCYGTWPAGRNGPVAQAPARRDPELEEMLVPRKMSISPLESWLSLRYLLPGSEARPPPSHCPPGVAGQGKGLDLGLGDRLREGLGDGRPGAPAVQCKNVLKIRRRKMNHHKYRKLVKRTRFLRRKVREGRRKRKQIRFEKDLKRIWKKAGLKQAPEGWQPPKIYVKN